VGISVYFMSYNVAITAALTVIAFLASIFIRKAFLHLLVGFAGFVMTYVFIVFLISKELIGSIPIEWLFGISLLGAIVSVLIRKFIVITLTSLAGATLAVSSAASIVNMVDPGIFAGTGASSVQSIGTNIRAFAQSIEIITKNLFDQIASFLYLDRLDIDLMPVKPTYANLSGGSQYFYFSLIVLILIVLSMVFQYRRQKTKIAVKTLENSEGHELVDGEGDFNP